MTINSYSKVPIVLLCGGRNKNYVNDICSCFKTFLLTETVSPDFLESGKATFDAQYLLIKTTTSNGQFYCWEDFEAMMRRNGLGKGYGKDREDFSFQLQSQNVTTAFRDKTQYINRSFERPSTGGKAKLSVTIVSVRVSSKRKFSIPVLILILLLLFHGKFDRLKRGYAAAVQSVPPSMKPSTKRTKSPSSRVSRRPTSRPSTRPTRKPSIRPTKRPSSKPSIRPTWIPTMKPTLSDGSRLISARYIKLVRVSITSYGDYYIHILGMDVYNSSGTFISDRSTSTMSSVLNSDTVQHGPQFLTDGVHQTKKSDGTYRMSHTGNDLSGYMQIDFGKDVLISGIVLWNRLDMRQDGILGCTLLVIKNGGYTVFSRSLNTVEDFYDIGFGPRPRAVFRISPGPILSLLGRCIDVPLSNFASGIRVQIYDCNGTPAQKWWRPTAVDLRLQTSNNLCMDAAGNAGAGGQVILSACDAGLDSQKWIYDGRSLRPNYNTGLCLTIQGGISINHAKLIVMNCDTSSSKAWVEYYVSLISGPVVSGDLVSVYICPVGSKVINISGRGGSWVDQIYMICDDVNNTIIGPAQGGTVGGSAITNPNCGKGYSAVSVTSGTWVGKVVAKCFDSATWTSDIGLAQYIGSSTSMTSLMLQSDQRIIGMQVYTGKYLTAMGLLYSATSAWRQTLSPITFPTMRPTSKPSLATGSLPISARIIKLLRVSPSNSAFGGSNYIHVLGVDVYNTSGTFISNQCNATMSSIATGDPSQYGPQYLIDGAHQEFKSNGSFRIPHTENNPGEYMQLDFGKDILISDIVIWNRVSCCSDRIIGVSLLIYNNAGAIVYTHNFTTVQSVYYWKYGPNQLSDVNIQYMTYQWIRNKTAILANYGHISTWDTSRVTNLTYVFGYWNPNAGINGSTWASSFNEDLSKWNISRVTSLYGMFHSATLFNTSLSQWDINRVTSMSYMFYKASSFNSYLSKWNTSRVITVNNMFYNATSFNQVVCWDTSKMSSDSMASMFDGSKGALENPVCLGFQISAFNHSVLLIPTPLSALSTPTAYSGILPFFNMSGQQRFIFEIKDNLFPDADYTLDPQVLISFNFRLTKRIGIRHAVCLLESESDLNNYCLAINKSCLFCFDLAGTNIQKTLEGAYPELGAIISYQFKPLDYFPKQSLNQKKIGYVAFINDSDGNESLEKPTSTYFNFTWIKLQTLNVTSPSNTQLLIKLPNSTVATSVDYFNLTCSKVISSYTITMLKTEVLPRSVLLNGLVIDKLESGNRYSILLQPAYLNGTIIPAQSSNQFFGYGVVTCSCLDSDTSDETGMPTDLSVIQSNGFISLSFTDNSVCEEAYALSRRQRVNQSIFAPNYYFFSTQECGNKLIPGLSYADNLSLSKLDIAYNYTYCVEAISANYMASSISVFNPNLVSSQGACKNLTIAWEASIKGIITSKADTGSIPIDNVSASWMLMNPNNTALRLRCKNPQSVCDGSITTDSSGIYQANFFVDEPYLSLNRTVSIPVLLYFNRSFDNNQTGTFLANDEKSDITTSGYVIYLQHLQFDRLVYVVDASTVAFTGNIYVRNTEFDSYDGCPVADADVCVYELKTVSGFQTTKLKLACKKSDSSGHFNLPLPIGSIVHNITISYFDHEFSPASNNPYALKYQDGIIIDPKIDYSKNNFVDMSIAPINVDVAGGLCNKTLGTAYIKYSILGCNWNGSILQQSNHFGSHFIPAQVVRILVILVNDYSNTPVTIVNNFFSDKQKIVDLRKYVDPSAASSSFNSDATGSRLGVFSPPMLNQTENTEYVRFQYDGNLKLKFKLTSADSVGAQCKQECTDFSSPYYQTCDSIHVISALSIVQFDVSVYYEILPGLTCDIVQDGTVITLYNHLGYENIPNFEQSDFFVFLPSDEKNLIKKCYPSCINNITYIATSDDGQALGGAGLHNFSLYAGRVEKIRPYTRHLLIRVSGYTFSAEYQEYEHSATFIIQGTYKDGDGLSFAFPTHTPVMILRDPPGGSSFASYENVKTTMTLDTRENIDYIENEISAGLELHTGFQGSTCFGLGAMVCNDNEFGVATTLLEISSRVGGRINYWGREVSASRSMTWTYQTSSDPWLAGAMSDIFMGKHCMIASILVVR